MKPGPALQAPCTHAIRAARDGGGPRTTRLPAIPCWRSRRHFDPDFRAVGAARYWGLIRLASFTIITQMATNVLVKAKGATMSGFGIGIFVEGDSATIVAVITRNNVSSG